MKTLTQLLATGLLGVSSLLAYAQEKETKLPVVEYSGNFSDDINNKTIYLARHTSKKISNCLTYLKIKMPPSQTDGYCEIFYDKGNDGTVDSYERCSLKYERGFITQSQKIKRTDKEITQEDQKKYNDYLDAIRELNKASELKKQEERKKEIPQDH